MNGLVVKFPETWKSGLETKGERRLPCCKLWLSERRLGLDSRVGEGVDPEVFPLPVIAFAKSIF